MCRSNKIEKLTFIHETEAQCRFKALHVVIGLLVLSFLRSVELVCKEKSSNVHRSCG